MPGTSRASGPRPSGAAGTRTGGAGRYPLGVTRYPAAERVPAPVLAGPLLSGGRLALSSLRGHVVVLNVWASWCQPCTAESPALVSEARATAGAGVRFVGVDETDPGPAARSFVATIGSPYPHLVDADGSMLAALARWLPTAVPGTLVIDPQGRVAARVIGVTTASQVDGVVRELSASGAQVVGSLERQGVRVQLRWQPGSGTAGELAATFTPLQPGFHLYSTALAMTGVQGVGRPTLVEPAAGLSLGPGRADRPVTQVRVAGVDAPLPVYPDGPVTLTLPATRTGGAARVLLTFAACSTTVCLPPVIRAPLTLALPS